jgi:predicted DCC family thiol-disulfide oxidoreductase YuxK
VKTLVLFDGQCGLCSGVVRFVLPRDVHGRFHFAPLQGPLAAAALARHGRSAASLDTFYLLEAYGTPQEQLRWKSDAARVLLRGLGGGWRLLGVLARLVPRGLRDVLYDFVAKRRYGWFGRTDACMLPDPAYRGRFLETVNPTRAPGPAAPPAGSRERGAAPSDERFDA